MEFITSIGTLLENFVEYVLPHAPFLGVTLILLVIGHRASTRIFTRSRAYRSYGPTAAGKWKWRWFYWGRETLPIQPIAIGLLIGFVWKDPENAGWSRAASLGYFASAGATSMILWAVLKGWTKKRGLTLQLPGESVPPVGEDRLPYDIEVVGMGGNPPISSLDPASVAASSEDVALSPEELAASAEATRSFAPDYTGKRKFAPLAWPPPPPPPSPPEVEQHENHDAKTRPARRP